MKNMNNQIRNGTVIIGRNWIKSLINQLKYNYFIVDGRALLDQ